MQFYIKDAGALRVLKHQAIDDFCNNRYGYNWSTRWGDPGPTNEEKAALHSLCDRLLSLKEPYKKMVYHSHVYIYSSSLEDLQSIADEPYISCLYVTQADVCLPEGVVLLSNPKRKYRTYFKDRWIPEAQSPVLKNFLLNRRDCFDFTPLFKDRLEKWDRFYTMSHFFVDHDDPKDLLMLELVVPGLIRKTMPIQAK